MDGLDSLGHESGVAHNARHVHNKHDRIRIRNGRRHLVAQPGMSRYVNKPDRPGTPAGAQPDARGRGDGRGVRGGRLVLHKLG